MAGAAKGKWNIARKKEKRMRTEESRAIPLFIFKNKFKEKKNNRNKKQKQKEKHLFFLPFAGCHMEWEISPGKITYLQYEKGTQYLILKKG